MKKLERFSMGIGDRFAHEGKAQLQAFVLAREAGLDLVPVWNKSNREHTIIKSKPQSVLSEASAAVASLGWKGAYHVDADHIGLASVDAFTEACDFFTLDVADFTGKPAAREDIDTFVRNLASYRGKLLIPGIETPFEISDELLRQTAGKFLLATQEIGKIYRHIKAKKGKDFITEVSVDETAVPQTPIELFLILTMLAMEHVPAQTIAPKFTGRFNKGVDYVGDLLQFEKEFDEDLAVVTFAIREFGLPSTLKLSIHSGSDKFTLYPIINRLIKKHHSGLHVKTAGTTWLEEIIGLAEAGGGGLEIAKEIYAHSFERHAELAAPYATVLDIDCAKLPPPSAVAHWDAMKFVATIRHDPSNPDYNLNCRQLLHVGFKVAAEMGDRYTGALKEYETVIAKNVTLNLLDRHIMPIFK